MDAIPTIGRTGSIRSKTKTPTSCRQCETSFLFLHSIPNRSLRYDNHLFLKPASPGQIIDSLFSRLETDAWKKVKSIEEKKFAFVTKVVCGQTYSTNFIGRIRRTSKP